MKNNFTPNLSQIKILLTVYELNQMNVYPVSEGILKILNGEEQEYEMISTYSTLTSYSQKKISRLLLLLFRYGYFRKIYDSHSDMMFISMTEYGNAFCAKYLNKHKKPFKKNKKREQLLYIKLQK